MSIVIININVVLLISEYYGNPIHPYVDGSVKLNIVIDLWYHVNILICKISHNF